MSIKEEIYEVYYTEKDNKGEEYTSQSKKVKACSPIDAMYVFKRKHPDLEIVMVV